MKESKSEEIKKIRKIASTVVSKKFISQYKHFIKLEECNKNKTIEQIYKLYGVLLIGSIRKNDGSDTKKQEFREVGDAKGFSNLTIDESMYGKTIFEVLSNYIQSKQDMELTQRKRLMIEEEEEGLPIKRVKIDHLKKIKETEKSRREKGRMKKKMIVPDETSGSSDESSIVSEDSRDSIMSEESQGDYSQEQSEQSQGDDQNSQLNDDDDVFDLGAL